MSRLQSETKRHELLPEFQEKLFTLMRVTAKLRALDPLTTELIRIKGANHHDCRRCKSRLTVSALEAGGSEDLYRQVAADFERAPLSERQKVALRLTDHVLSYPRGMDAAFVEEVRAHFTPAEVVEMLADIMRNSSQKVVVAFRDDEPLVTDGFELYDTDDDGNTVHFGPQASASAAGADAR